MYDSRKAGKRRGGLFNEAAASAALCSAPCSGFAAWASMVESLILVWAGTRAADRDWKYRPYQLYRQYRHPRPLDRRRLFSEEISTMFSLTILLV